MTNIFKSPGTQSVIEYSKQRSFFSDVKTCSWLLLFASLTTVLVALMSLLFESLILMQQTQPIPAVMVFAISSPVPVHVRHTAARASPAPSPTAKTSDCAVAPASHALVHSAPEHVNVASLYHLRDALVVLANLCALMLQRHLLTRHGWHMHR